ncbi:MAG: chorismate synthase [Coriobacteriia bacterium]|nr:chorismate synthase [Coriobacteriia bacterium]
MRYVTSGESHGRALTATVLDVPAGVPVDQSRIDFDLARRQVGYGRGGRMRIEQDRALILSGVRFGQTIGSPVTLSVANRDWDNWTDVMAVTGESPSDARVTAPRPGHADLTGVLRNASNDVRDVLERASARETAARVAAGAIARAFLGELGVTVHSFVTSIGDVAIELPGDPASVDVTQVEASDVRCPDAAVTARMHEAIDAARTAGESLGGTFVVTASGLTPGLGDYAQADRRLDARLAAAIISIPAIKGVEFGDGFASASRPGSRVHDEILFSEARGYHRRTNHAGGLEGGMSNGEPLVIRAAMKPIPTLMKPLASVDIDTHEPVDASKERSDVCAVPAAAVVGEAEVAIVIAAAYLDAFGRTSLVDIKSSLQAYRSRIIR